MDEQTGSRLGFEARDLAEAVAEFFEGVASYDDLLEARATLEPLCARLAAEHPDREAAMRRFRVPDHDCIDGRFRDDTQDFHDTVYDLTDNPVLSLLAEAVTTLVVEHLLPEHDPVDLHHDILDDHADIAGAIASGEAAAAERLMTDHLTLQHEHFRHVVPDRLAETIVWS